MITDRASFFERHAAGVMAVLLILGLYWFARLPQLSNKDRSALAAHFSFEAFALLEAPGFTHRSIRAVHPSLERISAWISSVGASLALSDLDGDGLSNDICYVNTMTDQVILAPVPVQPNRYSPTVLNPGPLRYDFATMAPMGCLPGDLNEDGRMDLLVYYWGRTPIAFLRAIEAGHFLTGRSFLPIEIVPGSERWYTNAATRADLDGDGHIDLVIGNYFKDGAQILDASASGKEQMQLSMSRAFNGGHNRLLLWESALKGTNPSVQFKEIVDALDEQVAAGWTLAVGAADLDGDLLPELYFANDFGPDRLLYNSSRPGQLHFTRLNGVKTFTTPNSKVLGRDSFKGMGVDFGDINSDGILDIYVSNIASQFSLEESHFLFLGTGDFQQMRTGKAPFIDRSEPLGLSRSGWGWETRLGDFNNDGVLEALQATGFIKGETNRWPELHELAMSNDSLLDNPHSWPRFQPGDDLSGYQHNPFFVRGSDGRFYDLAFELGLGRPQVTRGIATADVDGDGDLDFAVANQWETSFFYRNDCPQCGSFLGLHLLFLEGEKGETTRVIDGHPTHVNHAYPAVGATAIVHLPDRHLQISQVDGGNGHSGKRSSELHFGLGHLPPSKTVDVELLWRDPSGAVHEERIQFAPGWHTVFLANIGMKE